MLLMRFVHFVGIALWIGGAVAAFVVAMAVRDQPAPVKMPMWPILARVHGSVIAPGAIATVASGLLLTMTLTNRGMGDALMTPGMIVMQVVGILAAGLALFVGVPTANQLAVIASRHEGDEIPPQAVLLRKRQAVASSVAGVLALLAMYFAVAVR